MTWSSEEKRVMSNPDNLIMSDSLKSLLSEDDLTAEIVNNKRVQPSFTMVMECGTRVDGPLEYFSESQEEKSYQVLLSAENACELVGKENIVSYEIKVQGSDTNSSIPVLSEESSEYSVQFMSDGTASLSVTITKASDT